MSYKGLILFLLLLSFVHQTVSEPLEIKRSVIVTTADNIPESVPGVPLLLVDTHYVYESTQYFLEDYSSDTIYVLGDIDASTINALSSYGDVVPLSSDELSRIEGEDLTLPDYVVVSDPDDPLYRAAQLLASYRGAPLLSVPQGLKSQIQTEWKFMQWEFIGSMWGMWEYALWDQTEDKLQWIGYRYLFTDSLFEAHSFRHKMKDSACAFLPEDTAYVAVVGDIGTSMEYWEEELSHNQILVPTFVSECDSKDYNKFRCDYAPFHQKYVAFTSAEYFVPVEELNGVLFQDAPKYWVSSEKEREDLIEMASPYIEVMPSPEVPLTLDYLLAETVAVGRFTGYDLADTVAFINRALFLPPSSDEVVIANNIEVPVYTHALSNLFEQTGSNPLYFPLGEAETHVLEYLQNTGVFIYNGTGNCSFFLPHFYKKGEGVATSLDMEVEGMEPHVFIFSPGNGCISFWFPDITNKYDVKISEGFSQKTWDFTAARPELFVLVSDLKGERFDCAETEIDTVVQEKMPSLTHFNSPFLYLFGAGPIGSSELPQWFIRKGASGFVINVGMQEVLTNFEFEVLFFSAALAGEPVGEAMLYAKNSVHTAGYWYPLSGLWMSEEQYVREEACCLFGDPASIILSRTPLSEIPVLDDLILNPQEEAQNLLKEIEKTKERLSESGIEVTGINEALAESQKAVNEKSPESALETVKNEYETIKGELYEMCLQELEKCEKIASDDPELRGIHGSARKAFDEERYTDCLILTSQIAEKGRSDHTYLFVGLGIGAVAVILIVYIVMRR